jgi:hypothetical protein
VDFSVGHGRLRLFTFANSGKLDMEKSAPQLDKRIRYGPEIEGRRFGGYFGG